MRNNYDIFRAMFPLRARTTGTFFDFPAGHVFEFVKLTGTKGFEYIVAEIEGDLPCINMRPAGTDDLELLA